MQTDKGSGYVGEVKVSAHKAYQAWDVYLRGRWIDTVFYDADMDAGEVVSKLAGDGYDQAVKVMRAR